MLDVVGQYVLGPFSLASMGWAGHNALGEVGPIEIDGAVRAMADHAAGSVEGDEPCLGC